MNLPKDATSASMNQITGFECVFCRAQFDINRIGIIDLHIRNHLDVKPYQCCYCMDFFWILEKLMEHNASKHSDRSSHRIQCKFCADTFDNIDAYAEHDNKHRMVEGFECHYCGEMFENEDLFKKHRSSHTSQLQYACKECDKRFSRSEDLNIHLRVHKNLPVFTCDLCARLYSTERNLLNHMQRIHESQLAPLSKPFLGEQTEIETENSASPVEKSEVLKFSNCYKCAVCGLKFAQSKTLCLHYKRNHGQHLTVEQTNSFLIENVSWEKKIVLGEQKCWICDETFSFRGDLVGHLRVKHNGDRPFRCATCRLQLSRSHSLVEHMKTHVVKRFVCKYCGLSFQHQSTLDNHVKRHTGTDLIKCDICDIPYGDVKSLQVNLHQTNSLRKMIGWKVLALHYRNIVALIRMESLMFVIIVENSLRNHVIK